MFLKERGSLDFAGFDALGEDLIECCELPKNNVARIFPLVYKPNQTTMRLTLPLYGIITVES